MTENNKVLGMDIGGTFIRAGLVDENFHLYNFEIDSSICHFGKDTDKVDALEAYIKEYCLRHCEGKLPSAVSIGFPSTLNKDRTIVISTPNLPGFDNLKVVDTLTNRLGVSVYINRDVNLLMIDDIYDHGLLDAKIVIGCYIGTGLGNAIYIDGKILSGKNGVAGELGHAPVLGCTKECNCGNTGCMETIASGRYLEELNNQYFQGEPISEIFTKYKDHEVICNYIEGLSIPIAMEINLLDPDCVILGGGVLQMKDFPMEYLLKMINRHARKPLPCNNLQIKFSTQNQHSGVIGAGMYAFNQIKKGEKYDCTCF